MIETLISRLRVALADTKGDPVITTRFGTIALSDYLDTRLVELVVHTSDLAAAVNREAHLPDAAVRRTLDVIADAAMLTGRGVAAVRQLSARDGSTFVLI